MIHGIDVSNHQGLISWQKVAESGIVQFAFIKASEGTYFRDKHFKYNWDEAKNFGLARGAYHYAKPSKTGAIEEAYYFLDTIKYESLEPGDILILDMEDPEINTDVVGWTVHFMEVVQSIVGFNPILYTGQWYIDSRMPSRNESNIGLYELWLAAYTNIRPPAPTPWQSYRLWQFTDKATIPGIRGGVDYNIFYGTKEELLAIGKPDIEKPPTPVDVEALKTRINLISSKMENMQKLLVEMDVEFSDATKALTEIKDQLGL